MASEDIVTRGEFELLKLMVTQNQARLESMDVTGTRGVGALQTRMDDFLRDFAGFKVDVSNDFKDHMQVHERDKQEHSANRKWAIGVVLTFLTAIGGLYPLLIVLAHK